MKNRVLILPLLFLFALNVSAISWEEIRNSDLYYSGEGYGETLEDAKQSALSDLIRQISVHVSSKMEILDDEKLTNDNISTESYFRKKVETFSETTLNNAKSFDSFEQNGEFGEMRYGYYVEKTELEKVFDARRQKIAEYIVQAQKSEQINKLDDALRQYYWAFQLVKTMPLASKEVYTDPKTKVQNTLVVWLPQKINDIFSDIRITSTGGRDITNYLEFTYKGKPITSLDYTYNDGKRWSNMFSAKDGRGIAEIVNDAPINSIKLRIEYAYKNESHIDYEVSQVMKVVKGKAMRKSFVDVPLNQEKIEDKPIEVMSSVAQQSQKSTDTAAKISTANATDITSQFIKAMQTNDSVKIKSLCTADGYSLYNRLMRRGNAKLLPLTKTIEYQQMGNQTLVRSIPMSFSFAKSVRKSFVENVVLTIDESNKIDNISFALEKITSDDIMSRDTWTLLARQQIICFLENYQTAFALKRLDYIERIFADDAIIIVGKVVKKAEDSGDGKKVVNKYIKRTQQTKATYIKNLQACFKSNEFIGIRFGSTKVIKANPKIGEVYGIQVKQDYYSAHYGDTGYLYLQVDMADPKLPVIRVRTWQDQPDPELGRVYGMGDFD